MAVKTYSAGVKEYRHTYWMPDYTPLDTDLLAVFKITPQPGVDREEAAAAVCAESSTGTWTLRGSAAYQRVSANARRMASISRCNRRGSRGSPGRSNPSRMFNASSVAMP